MDVYEAIYKRRTIRGFTKGASEDTLKKIILAGTHSMSGGNFQPWEFIIIDDPKTIDQIAEIKYQMNRKMGASLGSNPEELEKAALEQKKAYDNCSIVAVCYKAGSGNEVGTWMCVQNMALAATAEGLGVVASTFMGKYQKMVEELLCIPQGYRLTTVMLIGVQEGYPNIKTDIPRRPDFSWLYRNSANKNLSLLWKFNKSRNSSNMRSSFMM